MCKWAGEDMRLTCESFNAIGPNRFSNRFAEAARCYLDRASTSVLLAFNVEMHGQQSSLLAVQFNASKEHCFPHCMLGAEEDMNAHGTNEQIWSK